MTLFRPFATIVLTVSAAALCGAAATQQTGPAERRLAIRSVEGQDLFEFYCASCHGRTGKGDGPAAVALKHPPPDLTLIARRNGNVFPKARLEAYVTNDTADRISAHGTRDMPIWGPIFMSLDPSDTMTRIRIANVVTYIESLQKK
jgi:mono/diheme cytochrome c family protein